MLLNDRIAQWKERTALSLEGRPESVLYGDLMVERERTASWLQVDFQVVAGDRVAFMLSPGKDYVVLMLALWRLGAIAVPLSPAYPADELTYLIQTVGPKVMVSEASYLVRMREVGQPMGIPVEQMRSSDEQNGLASGCKEPALSDTAMILFTSGTTSRPKGVMITHGNLCAQMGMLTEAWQWQPSDRILHVLPLHHVHGIVNALLCALWAGAEVVFLPKFDAAAAWRHFGSGRITVFMGVPTMYAKLVEAYESASHDLHREMAESASKLRLTVSGSAALPVSMQDRWKAISGRYLLERYGMTEIGMALGMPYGSGGSPGSVGIPFPTVAVKIAGDANNEGELWVKGPSVFAGYWQRPKETADAFENGWFKTGDMVARDERGYFRILGRKSTDILKSGGYKLSALEIEEAFREHPEVVDCAVVGILDDTWGEVVCMAAVGMKSLDPLELAEWGRNRMAAYKVPRKILLVEDLPRNAMGKVIKAQVVKLFESTIG